MKKLEDYVVSIPDFPEPGIIFRDVTSVLQDADGLNLAIHLLMEKLEGLDFDVIAGAESRGQKVVLIDDLIATGGTSKAMIQLVESLGGVVVKNLFLMELAGLNGRAKLEGYNVDSVIVYDGK